MEEHYLGKCKILLNYSLFCTTWNRFKCGISELCNTRILFRNVLLCIYHLCWEWNRIIFTERHFMEDTAERNSFQRKWLVESSYEFYVDIRRSSKNQLLFLIFPFLLLTFIHISYSFLPSLIHSFTHSFIYFYSVFSLPRSFLYS
jgi:hypothetical protein